MPALRKPHRIALLVPDLTVEGPDGVYEREAQLLLWTALIENQIPDTMKARGLSREAVINDVLLAKQPTKKFVQVEEVAALALFMCRDEAGNMTGANISMDGGWTAE